MIGVWEKKLKLQHGSFVFEDLHIADPLTPELQYPEVPSITVYLIPGICKGVDKGDFFFDKYNNGVV